MLPLACVFILHYLYCIIFMSITTPQDAHKLVLQVAELLTASLSGLPRHEINYITFSTGLKNK